MRRKENILELPALTTGYSDDFGNPKDKLEIVNGCKVIPDDASPDIAYKGYDWTVKLNNYNQLKKTI